LPTLKCHSQFRAADHRGSLALGGALQPPDDKKPLHQQGNRGLQHGAKAALAYMWSIVTLKRACYRSASIPIDSLDHIMEQPMEQLSADARERMRAIKLNGTEY
jgi:hypothetical protein